MFYCKTLNLGLNPSLIISYVVIPVDVGQIIVHVTTRTRVRKYPDSPALCCIGVYVHPGETLIDLQILGCELHKNAFGGPAGGAMALPRPPSHNLYKGQERKRGEGIVWE